MFLEPSHLKQSLHEVSFTKIGWFALLLPKKSSKHTTSTWYSTPKTDTLDTIRYHLPQDLLDMFHPILLGHLGHLPLTQGATAGAGTGAVSGDVLGPALAGGVLGPGAFAALALAVAFAALAVAAAFMAAMPRDESGG